MYFWCDSAVVFVFLYQNTKETRLLLSSGTELGDRKLLQKHISAQNKFYVIPPFLFKKLSLIQVKKLDLCSKQIL